MIIAYPVTNNNEMNCSLQPPTQQLSSKNSRVFFVRARKHCSNRNTVLILR